MSHSLRVRIFQVFGLLLVATSLVSLVAVAEWRSHGKVVVSPLAAITPSAADARTIPYRVEQLELGLQKMADQHDKLMWLLVANLAGVAGSLATYILTNRRRFFAGRPGGG